MASVRELRLKRDKLLERGFHVAEYEKRMDKPARDGKEQE